MKICSNCKHSNLDDANFCSKCNNPFPQKKKSTNSAIIALVAVGAIIAACVLCGVIGMLTNQTNQDKTPRDTAESTPATVTTPFVEVDKEATPKPTEEENKVTAENFKRLKNGMTYEQVVEILGKEGELMSENEIAGTKTEMYQWKAGMMANMNAMFQNGKMISKAQFGLE